jgi:hypothetical protein
VCAMIVPLWFSYVFVRSAGAVLESVLDRLAST